MDRMLVVVFDNEAKAYEGKRALAQLDSEGNITLYGYAVISKNKDGSTTWKKDDDYGPLGTVAGTTLGSVIGMFFGPVGLAVGATVGLAGGATFDLTHGAVGEDFVNDVSSALTPGKVAVVAEIEEDWTTPVDSRMEAIGGTIFRRALSDVRHQIHHENVAAMKADMAQLKAEHAQAHADRKAKLQEKINKLDTKIQNQLQKAKDNREAAEREAQAKVEILKSKAAVAEAAVR